MGTRSVKMTAIDIAESIPHLDQGTWLSRFAKRAFDIALSGLGLFLLSPLFIFIMLLLKREALGPVLYRGQRLGRGGRVFNILKFRTMYERPESYEGPRVTARDDQRITPLGRWLRDTKLNELPQLWNVLVGQMSLVGPRPEDPEIAAAWPPALRDEILSVRPGITSPASVAYHDEERHLQSNTLMDDYIGSIQPDKLRLDQLYVRHHNFITDLDAIFWTFVLFIPRLGGRRITEGWLFGGPISRILRRYVSWTLVDFIIAFLSIALVGWLWRLNAPLDIGLIKALELAVLVAALYGLFNTLLGLKVVDWSHAAAEEILRLAFSSVLVTLTVLAVQFAILPAPVLPLHFMLDTCILVLFGCIAVRYRLRLITGLASRWISLRRGTFGVGERVLVVGAGEGGEFAGWLLRRADFRRLYTVVGTVDDNPSKQGLHIDGLKVLGTVADIPEIVSTHDIGVIFYAISKISPADSRRILSTCQRTGLHIVMLSDMLRTLHVRLTRDLPRCDQICPYLVGSDSQLDPVSSDLGAGELSA